MSALQQTEVRTGFAPVNKTCPLAFNRILAWESGFVEGYCSNWVVSRDSLEALSGQSEGKVSVKPSYYTSSVLSIVTTQLEHYSLSSPHTFGSGGSGGGRSEQSFDGADYMTIMSRDSFGGKTNSTTISRWNGEKIVVSDAKK